MVRLANPVVKGLVALALVAAGYSAVTRSLAAAVSQSDPVLALRISSADARVKASAAQQLVQNAKNDDDRRQAQRLAGEAFAQDGTALPAAAALGLSAGISGDDAMGDKWFAYAERLSRRDLPTQLYFIEKAVANGDIAGALHHYDIALRTSSERAPSVLYPVLRSAIADATVRSELAKTLAARPIWTENFVADLVGKGPDYLAAAQLLTDARRRGAVFSRGLDETLLSVLIRDGQIPVAWKYYAAANPQAGRQLLRNEQFAGDGNRNSPFDWQPVPGDGVSVSLGAGANGRGLEYRLPPTAGGPVINQVMLLPAGKYRLSSVVTSSSQDAGGGPYWRINCIDSRPVATLELGGPSTEPRAVAVEFDAPASCSALNLTLVVRSSDDVQGARGQVASASISRIAP